MESKSVEDQVVEKESTKPINPDVIAHRKHLVEAQHQRERQELELQRERVLNERTSNPNRRVALAAALADIEKKLEACV